MKRVLGQLGLGILGMTIAYAVIQIFVGVLLALICGFGAMAGLPVDISLDDALDVGMAATTIIVMFVFLYGLGGAIQAWQEDSDA